VNDANQAYRALQQYREYADFAVTFTQPHQQTLFIFYGVYGSGKSTLAQSQNTKLTMKDPASAPLTTYSPLLNNNGKTVFRSLLSPSFLNKHIDNQFKH